MRCSVKNGPVAYEEFCTNEPEWIIETLGMGYPSNQLVAVSQEAFCMGHFVRHITNVAVERTKTTAGMRVVRLAHWQDIQNRANERRIGR